MSPTARKRNLPRADQIVRGLWRLRLPIVGWPAVPHVNAFAIAAGSGVVLVDTGLAEAGGLRRLGQALEHAGLRLEHIRLLVCTHAHSDHYGLAAPILEAAGCELWMHPNHAHMTRAAGDPERALERRIEVARQSGVPEEALREYQTARKGQGIGIVEIVEPDRDLVPTSALGRSTRRPAMPPRTSCCTSPTGACSCRATTSWAACRSTTTTAGPRIRPESS